MSEEASWKAKLGMGVAALCGVLAAFYSYSDSVQFARQRKDPFSVAATTDRFAPALEQVPQNARVGYLSELPLNSNEGNAAFIAAQYAVAPRQLVLPNEKCNCEWAVGIFSKPDAATAAGTARGFIVAQDLRGYALYRRAK